MDDSQSQQTVFIPIPEDLYRRVEPEVGEIQPPLTGRFRTYRPTEEFHPDWEFLLSGAASKEAVVAALHLGRTDPPEHAWKRVVEIYCPHATALLADAGVSYDTWRTGRADMVLTNTVAATANIELGGYAVFTVLDVPGMVSAIIDEVGTVPRFD